MNDADPITRLNAALEGRYRIESELGEGGMATVYLADDIRHERKVALKVLKPELAAVVGADRFLAEIKTTANLQHPHILPLHDSGEADGFLYYVMPYIEGESLRKRLDREHQLPVDEAVRIASELAEALQAAHEQGVVHRDIKPANIMLSRGRPLVADFGIALAVSAAGGTRLTETGLSLGTPHYMSPEQATGDQVLGPATDIYALGCVLYETLVGEPPHTGSTAQAILGKIVMGEPVSATKTRSSVPANVDAVIRKALERLPADRFATAQDFTRGLADSAFGHGREAAPVAGGARRAAILVGGGIGIVLGAAIAIPIWEALTPASAVGVSRIPIALRPNEFVDPGTPAGSATHLGPQVAISPQGSIVYTGPLEGSPGFQLWMKESHEAAPRPIPGTEGGYQPFFAPEGDRVGFIQRNAREIRMVALDGSPPVPLESADLYRLGGSWSTDGHIYFVRRPGGELARVSTDGVGPEEVIAVVDTAAGHRRHAFPQALPNGRGVLVTTERIQTVASEADSVAVVDLSTGEVRPLVGGQMGRYLASGHLLYLRWDQTLMAAPFDQERLELTGEPVPLIDDVRWKRGPTLAVSGDGTLIYSSLAATAEQLRSPDELVWLSRDGELTVADTTWTADFSAFSLSPSGDRVAATIEEVVGTEPVSHIWIGRFSDGTRYQLTLEGSGNMHPSFTRDGRSIFFASNREGGWDIYRRSIDQGARAELIVDEVDDVFNPVLSADGRWLVYLRGVGLGRGIYARRLDDPAGEPVPVADLPGVEERAPVLSAGDRWVAFVSSESGRSEVWVTAFPGGGRRWQVSFDGGVRAGWSRDRPELLVQSGGGGSEAWRMISVEVEPGRDFVGGPPRELLSLVGLDLGRDFEVFDDRFLFVRSRAPESYNFVLVENLSEELKGRNPD